MQTSNRNGPVERHVPGMTLNPRQETIAGVFWLPLESWSLLGFRKANVQFTFKSLEIGKCSHFCLHNVWFYLQFNSGSLRCHPCSPKKFPSRNSVGKMGWGAGAGYAGEGRKACLPALVQLNKSFQGILIQALDQNDSFLSCNPYCFIYEIHINLGEWFRIFFFFLKNVKSFYQQIHRSKHLLDSHFCFPQRRASWLPLTCSFIFKVRLQGWCEAPSCTEVTDDSVNYPECKGNLVHL